MKGFTARPSKDIFVDAFGDSAWGRNVTSGSEQKTV
jgi:hypothetical protein